MNKNRVAKELVRIAKEVSAYNKMDAEFGMSAEMDIGQGNDGTFIVTLMFKTNDEEVFENSETRVYAINKLEDFKLFAQNALSSYGFQVSAVRGMNFDSKKKLAYGQFRIAQIINNGDVMDAVTSAYRKVMRK